MREILRDLKEILFDDSTKQARPGHARPRGGGPHKAWARYSPPAAKPEGFSYGDLKLLLPFVRPNWGLGAAAAALALVSTGVMILIPILFKYIADEAVLRGNHRLLNILIALLIGALATFTLTDFFKQIYFFRFQQAIVFGLQGALLNKLLRLPKAFYDANSTGYLMSRGIGDAFQLQAFFSLKIVDIFTKSLQIIFAVCIVFFIDWRLALLSFVMLPLLVVTARLINGKTRQVSHAAMEKTAIVSRDLQESLSGAALIKAFAAEEREVEKLLGGLREAFRANQSRAVITAFYTFLSGMINALGMGLVLWYGARQIINQELTVGELLAFSAYLGFLIEPATFLANAHNSFQQTFAALERVFELMNLVPEESSGRRVKLERLSGRVRFEGVSFSYEGQKKALEDISFDVGPGQLVAIVGPSGAGKSTLANLVLGLYQPSSGKIFYDEMPSADLDLRSLRERVGLVSQEMFLFDESVKNNIRYGRLDASDEEVIGAARIAASHEFITQLPDGYETRVGEKGVKLSVGQKQRLSIARAILKNPDVLILDEVMSALDTLTERTVQKMLREFYRGRTVFVIAHRLSTVMMSDLILALDKGHIVQRGTHAELFEQEGLYRQLCLTQFLRAEQAPEAALISAGP